VKLHELRNFVAIAESGGIRAAARHLHLSQPALSKSISQLEEELGTPLFERNARGSSLNIYGQRFLMRAQAALAELERGREEITQMHGETGGNVSFAASSVVALTFLTSSMTRFRRRFPQARVNIYEGTYAVMLRGLRDRSLDFAVGPVPTVRLPDDLVMEILFANSRSVIGRRGHPLAKSKGLANLINADWLTTSAVGPKDDEFLNIFRENGLDAPTSLIRCESLIALLAILAGGDALAFLPRQWAVSPVTNRILAEIPIAEQIPGPSTCLIRPNSLPLTPAAESLADAMRAGALNSMRDSG
jgi:LysR family transcriptional regulator, regulator of abg operon